MQRSVSVFILSLLLAGAWPCPAWAGPFRFTTIEVPDSRSTSANDINNAGEIVGSFIDSTGAAHGFLLSGGTLTTIAVPGGTRTHAYGINDVGQIVGTFYTGDPFETPPLGFLLSEGTFTTIDVPDSRGTTAAGINAAGQIVGSLFDDTGSHGFLLSGGIFTTIDHPEALYGTQVSGINDAGQIVGTFYTGDFEAPPLGFLLSEGTFARIGVPGSSGTTPAGINAAGQIVGSFFDDTGRDHGFLLSGGIVTTIDHPKGLYGTRVSGINDAGQIVGWFEDAAGTHGFLATPVVPEPGTLIMLSTGLVGLLWRGARRPRS